MSELTDFAKALGLPGLAQQALVRDLEARGKALATGLVRDELARVLLKAIDEVVTAVVRVAPADGAVPGKAGRLVLDRAEEQVRQLFVALGHYVPLQVAVETAKHRFGRDSVEANAARAARKMGIEEVRREVGDVFAVLIGAHAED